MSIGLYDSVLYALCVLYLLISLLLLPLLVLLTVFIVSAKIWAICRASNSRNLWVFCVGKNQAEYAS